MHVYKVDGSGWEKSKGFGWRVGFETVVILAQLDTRLAGRATWKMWHFNSPPPTISSEYYYYYSFASPSKPKRVWPRQTVKRNCVSVRTKTRKKKHFDISGRGKVTMEFGIDCVVEKSNKSPKSHQRHLTVTLYTLSWCRRQIRQMIKIEVTKCFFFSLFEFCIVVVAYLMSSGEFEESWTPEGEWTSF